MSFLVMGPQWFSGFEHLFEIISLLAAIFVGYYSYRVYRYTNQPKYRTMAAAFIIIALSFGLKVLTDVGVRAQVAEMGGIQNIYQVLEVGMMLQSGYLAMRFFMLLGLVLLLKLAFDIRENRLLLLLAVLSILTTFLSHSVYYAFHIAAALMLGFIVEFMYRNFRNKKTKPACAVLLAFTFLFLSQLAFMFVGQSSKLHALGETLQLGGFITLIVNHVLLLRR